MKHSFLAVSFGLAMLIGNGTIASAQEASGTAPAQPSEKADAGASKSSEAKAKSSKSSSAKGKSSEAGAKLEKATFGGGCFWCMEAVFERVKGVKSVVSGYAGGTVPRPSYEMVQTGLTGHAEVIQVTFDPEVVSYDYLLTVFWASHDPTSLNRQGPDEGTEYRSVILYHNDAQKQAAQKSYQKLTQAGAFPSPIVTQLVPLKAFYPAEKYHQNYYRLHGFEEYSQTIIAPKLQMMKYKIQKLSTPHP